MSLPPSSAPTTTGWSDSCRRDSHPLRNGAFHGALDHCPYWLAVVEQLEPLTRVEVRRPAVLPEGPRPFGDAL